MIDQKSCYINPVVIYIQLKIVEFLLYSVIFLSYVFLLFLSLLLSLISSPTSLAPTSKDDCTLPATLNSYKTSLQHLHSSSHLK